MVIVVYGLEWGVFVVDGVFLVGCVDIYDVINCDWILCEGSGSGG